MGVRAYRVTVMGQGGGQGPNTTILNTKTKLRRVTNPKITYETFTRLFDLVTTQWEHWVYNSAADTLNELPRWRCALSGAL